MSNSISDRDSIIEFKNITSELPERESNPYWIAITPIPVQFKGHGSVPDSTQGLVVGISNTIGTNVVVRANYPYYGNDVWAISIDHIEGVKE
jgi:hypothetical protein